MPLARQKGALMPYPAVCCMRKQYAISNIKYADVQFQIPIILLTCGVRGVVSLYDTIFDGRPLEFKKPLISP